eukprot:1145361-Pelagomonas_calceolata.AAC.2
MQLPMIQCRAGGRVIFDYFDDKMLKRNGRMDMLEMWTPMGGKCHANNAGSLALSGFFGLCYKQRKWIVRIRTGAASALNSMLVTRPSYFFHVNKVKDLGLLRP